MISGLFVNYFAGDDDSRVSILSALSDNDQLLNLNNSNKRKREDISVVHSCGANGIGFLVGELGSRSLLVCSLSLLPCQ